MSPRVILIGAPGAGKTTIGRALAQRLDVDFRDTDHEIERLAGKPISDIFVDDGEEAFRALETQALTTAILECNGVLALGGGVVMRPENRTLLESQLVVWLDVTLAEAVRRIGLGTTRPLLMGNVRGRLMQLMAERSPVYAATAALRVDTSARDIADIVADLQTRISEGI